MLAVQLPDRLAGGHDLARRHERMHRLVFRANAVGVRHHDDATSGNLPGEANATRSCCDYDGST